MRKSLQETWLDWQCGELPPLDELLTREQLLERLNNAGVDVTERRLMFWETFGALPRPVRKRHDGATRALYPAWFIDAASIVANRKRGEQTDPCPCCGQQIATLAQARIMVRQRYRTSGDGDGRAN